MKRTLFGVLGLILICTAGLAADGDKGKSLTKVIGLDVHRTESEQIFSFNPGTTVEVLLSQPGKFILAIDAKASKLDSFTDDKKTDLTKSPSPFHREWLNASFLRFNKDNSQCVFQVYAPSTPAEGANKITVKGTLAVLVGKDEKTVEQKNQALKVGDKATFDTVTMNVQKGFQEGKQVSVTFVTPERTVKTVEFIDSKGKPINQIFTNTSPTFVDGKNQFQTMCSLAVPSNPVTVKVTYFSKTEKVDVPIDLSFGLGF